LRISGLISGGVAAIVFLFAAMLGTTMTKARTGYCAGGMGVHRTVALDTEGGARFGSSHGRNRNFLKQGEVVLTFDDGPVPGKTNKVLHTLEKHCAKATFFMVGSMARNNASLARKVIAKGHTVGVHSYSHRNLGHMTASAAIDDVERSIRAIHDAAGPATAPFFRFPYLSENKAVNTTLNRQDYGVFAIDVDSLDYRMPNPSAMVNRVMSELKQKGKGIILLHDIQAVTANGLDQLLDRLNAEGYKLVHVRSRGRTSPKPLLLADASEKNSSTARTPNAISNNSSRQHKSRNAVRKRTGLARIRQGHVKLARLSPDTGSGISGNSQTMKAALLFNQTFRASVKKRILDKNTPSARREKPQNKRVTLGSRHLKPKQNPAIRLAVRNRNAFRKALKQRFITN
jgi:peptidoglycan/xylan/chitin deacetylase (PgdA/CDA1 family)